MSESMDWLLYGAYGYTGSLIAEEAVRRGLRPVLAGRIRDRTRTLAQNLDLEHRVFALDDPTGLRRGLDGMDLVLHAAGPYSRTFQPMAGACLDVVPTDCLAARAVEVLPDASRIDLALHSEGRASRGTARTIIERLNEPAKIRDGGRIVDVGQGAITRTISFGDRERMAACITWGDVSTAFYSTGVPHIRVFMTFSPSAIPWLKVLSALFRIPGVPQVASWVVKHTVDGPSEEERRKEGVRIWCEATEDEGEAVRLEMTTPNGYTFTARSAVSSVERIASMTSDEVADLAGFQTPSSAFGAEFVDDVEGVEWIERGSAVKRGSDGGGEA